jgi:hypothetical protein
MKKKELLMWGTDPLCDCLEMLEPEIDIVLEK